ncbi:MAG TPA: helix-turn-helix domain-containing protein [Flavilitoribacter sp.]|nr:helix-turn-helix domain-containing protein [Flavilitoribacter sp.]HMQ88699.1 helix-turn-helix domain-containing protein [Flavilitoribacter sp.]
MRTIAIIGAGLSGALLTMNLLKQSSDQPVFIKWIDRNNANEMGRHTQPTKIIYLMCRLNSWGRFRMATELSPILYVQNLRVDEARRLLERSMIPVEEIAYQVGYDNTAFFSRVFKRATRLTPGTYRRKFGLGNLNLTT